MLSCHQFAGVDMGNIHVGISEEKLSIEKAMDFVDASINGAIDIFVGRVRNHNLGREVNAVSYTAYDPLACSAMKQICEVAIAKFDDRIKCYVEHYKGQLEIGGISVVIAVGSPHRDECFKACRYIIEELKIRVPVWKQEHYIDGDSGWLEGNSLNMEVTNAK